MSAEHQRRRRTETALVALLGVLLVVGAGVAATGALDWRAMAGWTRSHAASTALGTAGVVCLLIAAIHRRRPTEVPGTPSALGHARAYLALLLLAVLVATWLIVVWLMDRAALSRDPAAAQIDALRTSLTVIAGSGGMVALLLALRRQWHQEINARATLEHQEKVAEDNRHDAAEKRITELYVKAADQLGSDKAAVRLSGLYALERLGQGNPAHRQTIVNVVCAYLRMPYTFQDGSESPEAIQELEVRMTAQRILTTHLRPAESDFWSGISLNLTKATLVKFHLNRCHVLDSDFKDAVFVGTARFSGTRFDGSAGFSDVHFTKDALFEHAEITGPSWFRHTRFDGDARFEEARFGARAEFHGAAFNGPAEVVHSAADLTDAVVRDPELTATRSWPSGWAVRADGRLVQDQPDPSSTTATRP